MDNAPRLAGVVELVDAPDSKSGARNGVGVRVPPPAPDNAMHLCQPNKYAARYRHRHDSVLHVFHYTKIGEFTMSKLLSLLIAGIFAAVSFTAVAADAGMAPAAPAASTAAPAKAETKKEKKAKAKKEKKAAPAAAAAPAAK